LSGRAVRRRVSSARCGGPDAPAARASLAARRRLSPVLSRARSRTRYPLRQCQRERSSEQGRIRPLGDVTSGRRKSFVWSRARTPRTRSCGFAMPAWAGVHPQVRTSPRNLCRYEGCLSPARPNRLWTGKRRCNRREGPRRLGRDKAPPPQCCFHLELLDALLQVDRSIGPPTTSPGVSAVRRCS
jgi:hypothetical protein